MGVFHWGRNVGNYGFFKGWEQFLQSRLGSFEISWLVPSRREASTSLVTESNTSQQVKTGTQEKETDKTVTGTDKQLIVWDSPL